MRKSVLAISLQIFPYVVTALRWQLLLWSLLCRKGAKDYPSENGGVLCPAGRHNQACRRWNQILRPTARSKFSTPVVAAAFCKRWCIWQFSDFLLLWVERQHCPWTSLENF